MAIANINQNKLSRVGAEKQQMSTQPTKKDESVDKYILLKGNKATTVAHEGDSFSLVESSHGLSDRCGGVNESCDMNFGECSLFGCPVYDSNCDSDFGE